MTNPIGFSSKVLLVCLSTLIWNSVETAAVAQAPIFEQASASEQVESSFSEVSDAPAVDEAALLEIENALDADSLYIETIDADTSDAETSGVETSNAETSDAETTDLEGSHVESAVATTESSALTDSSILGELESVGLESVPFDAAEADLAAVASAFAADEQALPALVATLESDNEMARLYAAETLWTLTGDRDLILPTLTAATRSNDTQVRELAITALAHLGEQALPAVPVLGGLLSDENARTRQMAQDALSVVRSDNRPASVLGIVTRAASRRLFPRALRAITNLF